MLAIKVDHAGASSKLDAAGMKIQMVSGLYLHELPSFVTVAFRN
jgi:hypothetical protein